MFNLTLKRLSGELKRIVQGGLPQGILSLEPEDPSDLLKWCATIEGPNGSPYENGHFKLVLIFSSNYPLKPPHVMFRTKIYHMNISSSGYICLSLLKEGVGVDSAWSPGISLPTLMTAIRSLLAEPNPEDPLVESICAEYMSNRRLHDEKARKWTERYAINK